MKVGLKQRVNCAGASDPMQVGQQGLMTIENWADPPLRGYSSMPTMHSVPEDHQLDGLALAVDQVLLPASHTYVRKCTLLMTDNLACAAQICHITSLKPQELLSLSDC